MGQKLGALALLLLAFPSLPANADSVRYLPTGKDALARLVHDIRSANSSIDMTYFEFEPCHTSTKIILNQLKAKAAKGIPVRILVDSYSYKDPVRRNFSAHLAKSGIDLRYFAARLANNHTHAKITLIDGKTGSGRYVSGGRNIGDGYFGLSSKLNYVDRDVAVQGASVKQAAAGYDRLWSSRPVAKPPGTTAAELQNFEATCMAQNKSDLDVEKYILDKADQIAGAQKPYNCANTSFEVDNPNFVDMMPGEGKVPGDEYLSGQRLTHKEASKAIIETLEGAKKTDCNQLKGAARAKCANNPPVDLVAENWAYAPAARLRSMYADHRKNGLNMEIYSNRTTEISGLNFLITTSTNRDQHPNQKIYLMDERGSMNDRWEKSRGGKWNLHAKTAVVNGKHGIVSSWNQDERSYHTNVESAVIVKDCPAFAATMTNHARKHQINYAKDQSDPNCLQPTVQNPVSAIGAFFGSTLY